MGPPGCSHGDLRDQRPTLHPRGGPPWAQRPSPALSPGSTALGRREAPVWQGDEGLSPGFLCPVAGSARSPWLTASPQELNPETPSPGEGGRGPGPCCGGRACSTEASVQGGPDHQGCHAGTNSTCTVDGGLQCQEPARVLGLETRPHPRRWQSQPSVGEERRVRPGLEGAQGGETLPCGPATPPQRPPGWRQRPKGICDGHRPSGQVQHHAQV